MKEWENDSDYWVECENKNEEGGGDCCIACENEGELGTVIGCKFHLT